MAAFIKAGFKRTKGILIRINFKIRGQLVLLLGTVKPGILEVDA
jgi:hypothetical protein